MRASTLTGLPAWITRKDSTARGLTPATATGAPACPPAPDPRPPPAPPPFSRPPGAAPNHYCTPSSNFPPPHSRGPPAPPPTPIGPRGYPSGRNLKDQDPAPAAPQAPP